MRNLFIYCIAGFLWLAMSISHADGNINNLENASSLKQLWTLEGLDQPESVVYYEQKDLLIVSNINGAPLELNNKGYLSLVSTDGKINDKNWVTQLNAPKGLALHENTLYVADMQTLHVINAKTGSILKQVSLKEAKMLNDITVDDKGNVYISDFLGGVIYQLKNDQLVPWFSSKKLPHPNGLLWQGKDMLVVAWGKEIQSDFSTKTSGSLYRLNLTTKELTPLANGYQLGNLDGVVSIADSIYVSDWLSGDLYHLHDNQRIKLIANKSGLADIGSKGDVIYAPMMNDGRLVAWKTVN